MESWIAGAFRWLLYVLMGFFLEVVGAVDGIERLLGCRIHRRVPRRYLEGFVSLYMAPLHGFGMLLAFEPVHDAIRGWWWGARFAAWAVLFAMSEAAWGLLLDRTLGFYPWDYYAQSRFRVFRRGYTLWTLLPVWGLVGLSLEVYSDLLRHLSPIAAAWLGSRCGGLPHGLGGQP